MMPPIDLGARSFGPLAMTDPPEPGQICRIRYRVGPLAGLMGESAYVYEGPLTADDGSPAHSLMIEGRNKPVPQLCADVDLIPCHGFIATPGAKNEIQGIAQRFESEISDEPDSHLLLTGPHGSARIYYDGFIQHEHPHSLVSQRCADLIMVEYMESLFPHEFKNRISLNAERFRVRSKWSRGILMLFTVAFGGPMIAAIDIRRRSYYLAEGAPEHAGMACDQIIHSVGHYARAAS